jgi:SAM-dependent methyltransferase
LECAYEGINFTVQLKPNKLKIFIYLYYFFRSVFLRGLFNTVKLLTAERSYEKKFGISTSAIKKSNSKEFFHYQGAGYLVLLRVFRETVKLTEGFDFVDIGCGKGRAIFVAEYCGYNRLTGIELDKELTEDAYENLKLYPFRRADSEIEFVHANALVYPYENRPTVYFLFNPFNENVLTQVLGKIVLVNNCETWFIYMNPLYPRPFMETGMEVVRKYKTGRYTEALVFRKPAKAD